MAGISTVNDGNSLDALRARWRFVTARLRSDRHTSRHVADFKTFGEQWSAANQKETELEDAVVEAQADAAAADFGLDGLADRVSGAIHKGKKVDTSNQLHQLYFGSLTTSEFKRPELASQLDRSHAWPKLLGAAPQPELTALAKEAATTIKAGDTAKKALADALKARDIYWLGGERKKLFDTYNALCAKLYGTLKAYAHEHPELSLSSGWAESFFQYGSGGGQGDTLATAAAEVEALKKKLAQAEKRHNALQTKAAERAAAQAAAAKARADADAAKKLAAEAKKAQKAAEQAARRTRR